MTPAERVRYAKNEAQKIIEEHDLKIIYEKRGAW
jgi:hypothetical protein